MKPGEEETPKEKEEIVIPPGTIFPDWIAAI